MKKILIAGAVATLAIASQADAAANLTYAAVTGNTYTPQTVWSTGTGASTANYTLFLLQPVPAGSYLNTGSNGKGLNDPTDAGMNNFSIYGESFVPGQTAPSDSSYTLTLRFADGAQVSGVYSLTANGGLGGFVSSASSTATAAGTTYTLNGFQWNRGGGDVVGPQSTGANGEGPDYSGLFSFSATAVPEPSTWAMMLVGFGMIGAVARRRRSAVKVTYA